MLRELKTRRQSAAYRRPEWLAAMSFAETADARRGYPSPGLACPIKPCFPRSSGFADFVAKVAAAGARQ
jgi:hypothetical protein